MKIRFVRWDWEDQPDIDWLGRALDDVFNGKNAPCVTEVDTHGDSNAIVVSGETIDKKQAQEIYDRYKKLPDETHPCNKVLDIQWP